MRRGISGIFNRIKTSQTAKVRSRPASSKDNFYLELYVMNLKKSRLVRELGHADAKKRRLEKDLSALNGDIEKVEKILSGVPKKRGPFPGLAGKKPVSRIIEY